MLLIQIYECINHKIGNYALYNRLYESIKSLKIQDNDLRIFTNYLTFADHLKNKLTSIFIF